MSLDRSVVIPNTYITYDRAVRSGIRDNVGALSNTVTALLNSVESRFAHRPELIGNKDGSVIANIFTEREGNIGQITFKVNEEIKQIEATYSNKVIKEVFQPLFTQNYYIDESELGIVNNDHLSNVKKTQNHHSQFYKRLETLEFAAYIEKFRSTYKKITENNPKLALPNNQKVLKRNFFGQVQENMAGSSFNPQEKIILALNEISRKEFFTTPPTLGLNPNNEENINWLKQRLPVLKNLCDILENYSNGISPNRNAIQAFRRSIKGLKETNQHGGDFKTQRILAGIGMGIGIPAFIAGIVLFAIMVALPVVPLALIIAAPVLFFIGGMVGGFSAGVFYDSFPQGISKDLYFVADKMEAELIKNFPGGVEDLQPEERELDVSNLTTETSLTSSSSASYTAPVITKSTEAKESTEEANEKKQLRDLLKSASTGLEPKEKEHLSKGLEALLNNEKGYDFKKIKKGIKEGSKTGITRFESLCDGLNVSSELPEEQPKPQTPHS